MNGSLQGQGATDSVFWGGGGDFLSISLYPAKFNVAS